MSGLLVEVVIWPCVFSLVLNLGPLGWFVSLSLVLHSRFMVSGGGGAGVS